MLSEALYYKLFMSGTVIALSALDGRLDGSLLFELLILQTLVIGTGIPCEKVTELCESRGKLVLFCVE